MNRLDVSKILFYVVSMTVIVGLSFACGLYSGRYQTSTFRAVWALKNTIEEAFTLVSKQVCLYSGLSPYLVKFWHFVLRSYFLKALLKRVFKTPGSIN